jgi:hypothetical protein
MTSLGFTSSSSAFFICVVRVFRNAVNRTFISCIHGKRSYNRINMIYQMIDLTKQKGLL